MPIPAWWRRVGWLGLALALAGCQAPPGPNPPAPSAQTPAPQTATLTLAQTESQPATAPASAPALDPKATLALDALEPLPALADAPQPTPPELQAELDKARALYAQGQYALAAEALQAVHAAAPDATEPRRLLGFARAKGGDFGAAAGHLQAVADQAGDDSELQFLLAQVALSQRHAERAIRHLRLSLAAGDADPADARYGEALFQLAELLGQEGYFQAALDAHRRLAQLSAEHLETYLQPHELSPWVFRAIVTLPPLGGRVEPLVPLRHWVQQPHLSLLRRGQLLLALHRPDEGVEAFDAAYRESKGPIQAGYLLQALVAAKRFDAGQQVLLEMVANPTTREAALKLAPGFFEAAGDADGPGRLLEAYTLRQGSPEPEVTVALASAAYKAGGHAQARAILDELARRKPDFAPATISLVGWLLADGEVDRAIEALAGLLARDTSSAPNVRAVIAAADENAFAGDADRRLAARARADSSDRKAIHHYLAALVAQRTGRQALAAEQLEAALRADEQFTPAYETLAETYLQAGQFDRVEGLIARARARTGETATSLYLLGRSQFERDQFEPAIETLRKSLDLKDDYVAARVLLARAYLQRGGPDDAALAERHLKEAITQGAGEEAFALLGDLYLRQREHAQALALARMLLARDPRSVPGLRLLLQVERAAGEHAAARRTMARLLELAPEDAEVRLLKVENDLAGPRESGVLGRRRFERAVKDVQAVLATQPSHSGAIRLLAELLELRGQPAEAADVMARAHQANPADVALASRYAALLAKAERFSQAGDVLGTILQQDPERHANYRRPYAAALSEAGRTEEALAAIQGWIDTTPPEQARLFQADQALVMAQGGQVDEALARIERLLEAETDPDRRNQFYATRLQILDEAGRYDDLTAAAETWMAELHRANPLPLLTAMELLLKADRPAEAEAFALSQMEALSAVESNDARELATALRPVLVYMMQERNHPSAVRRLWDAFVAQEPENLSLLLAVQLAYDGPEHEERIASTLQRVLQIDPGNNGARNNLGYLWADRGVNLDQAERLLHQAVQAEAAPNVQDSYGWVQYKLGNFRKALDYLRLGLNHPRGEHAVIYDHAGDTWWRLGEKDKALEMWTEAIDLAEAELSKRGEALDADTRRVAEQTPRKIEAALEGQVPPVAPLGEGVSP